MSECNNVRSLDVENDSKHHKVYASETKLENSTRREEENAYTTVVE